MNTLRIGSMGEDVERWQYFLRGVGLYLGEVDGTFGELTKEATQDFQRRHGLVEDGVAGNRTIGEAMRVGFDVVTEHLDAPTAAEIPPRPNFARLDQAGREAAFGRYPFVSAPVPGNPEAIRIGSNWAAENIVVVEVPQLAGVKGAPASGKVQLHKKVAPRIVELFEAWDSAGLMTHILTYGGSFVPRFVRGSRTTLSPHAHGSAFDINVAWNGFGAVPAVLGAKGSVRALVPIANEFGLYWGGHFTKRDGMHFEVARL
ncbi:MAG TPA: peptidoglycan-binding protein [Polyangiaceae bacterium]